MCFVPRKARIDYPGGAHHLIIRGIKRKRIFQDDRDRDAFLDRLRSLFWNQKHQCFAWVQLPNYLLLKTGQTPEATLGLLTESEAG